MAFLIHHIKTLVHTENEPVDFIAGMDMNRMQSIDNAFLLIEGDTILDFGREEADTINRLSQKHPDLVTLDAGGGHVFPSWCDAHTHLVFAGSREKEFEDRINGLSYQEIAQRGGGILNSARRLSNATEQELFEDAVTRIREMIRMGTGAIEIKSGYGLDEESELKILRVIQRLKQEMPVAIRATFLGAHAVPEEFRNDKAGYIRLLTDRIMPRIASEKLADYCDVFCESGYFTKKETITILEAGLKYGMIPKVHAEQLSHHGGIEAGVACGAFLDLGRMTGLRA